MAFMNILSSVLRRVGRSIIRTAARDAERRLTHDHPRPKRGRPTSASSTAPRTSGKVTTRPIWGDGTAHTRAQFPGPNNAARVYDVTMLGLPTFSYAPVHDDAPDPGEVVWTWIPYEENDGRGKDRPVLVVAQEGHHVFVAQLTSKDHDLDAAQEARWGRHWMDIGTGNWDPEGRPSEVRLDRLLVVHENAVRREGGQLQRDIFDEVIARLRSVSGDK
ncbi:type II toxin-antitoxin system PemK/MazF family toxin [Arcanobacterium canis]|uniref:Type II toxin-antitoxin system PemK/MazF family toxin n=1 Tax=Arcanobacterium canis TaxID=999183 RepID=A0ABY8G1G8_9ACTO|nr:type II toxin-antitoxin system PemK/MazF family toxin [Arcanobacterium canis]WFM84045.1 type II toxin-antitoxin system PemK/MazF family toxin [Arcanobacterium canis]